MLSITTQTSKNPSEVLDMAVTYFGPEGLGLEHIFRDAGYVRFKGGGGYIQIAAYKKGEHTKVDIESREWDRDVKKFLEEI